MATSQQNDIRYHIIKKIHAGGYSLQGFTGLPGTGKTLLLYDIAKGLTTKENKVSLAMEVKRIQPSCKIVFISSTKEFAIEAFQIYASGYLLKPITPDEVDALLDNIFGMEQ